MSEEKPKSIWKKTWNGWRGLLLGWLLLTGGLILIFLVWMLTERLPLNKSQDELQLFVAGWAALTIVFLLATFIRWTCHWRNFKKFLFGLACFISLVALFYAEEDWRGKHDWNKFKREWAAKGVDFDWGSNIPPPVPDSQNFAMTPIVSSCYEMYFNKSGHRINPPDTNIVDRFSILSWRDISYEQKRGQIPDFAGWPAAQAVDLKAWQAYFRSPPPDPGQTNSFPVTAMPQAPADDVLLALSKYDAAVREIREASRRPYSRFPLTYESSDVASIILPHLGALKTTTSAISLRSVAELREHQTVLAAEDARLGLYLANAVRVEPFPVSQWIRVEMIKVALQPVWEGLAGHQWSEAQLAALDADLAEINLLADGQRTQIGEIAADAKEAHYLRSHRDYAAHFARESAPFPNRFQFQMSSFRYLPGGWFYQSALKNSRSLSKYLKAIDRQSMTISPSLVERLDKSASQNAGFFDPLGVFKEIFNGNFFGGGNFLKEIAYGQASVDLARTAIALERYRLAHGDYPESLDALAPQFIAAVPHDVIGGGPLHYRRDADGSFVLYSIGWNERDDGGVVVFHKGDSGLVNISEGDWVWRYPAK